MGKPLLVTIPFSHFCEKARWGLERAGVAYDEEPHAPLLHWTATWRLHARSVPVLVTTGATLKDSTDILRWADARTTGHHLYPDDPQERREVEELEELFDVKLGPATRRWAYFHVLQNRRMATELLQTGVPRGERTAIARFFVPITTLMKRGMNVTPEASERSLARIRAIFSEVSGRLREGRRYLVGDRFTAADLAFASLAGPALGPPQYVYLPSFDSWPEAMRREAQALRDTPAGQHALRMWREERPRS